MSAQTFDEAVSQARSQEHPEVMRIKRTFVEPLRELGTLRDQWQQAEPGYRLRLDHIFHRMQQAQQAGVDPGAILRLVNPAFNELAGGGDAMRASLLDSTSRQITDGMANMQGFGPVQLAQRVVWSVWPSIPARVKDNILAIETRLDCLEVLTGDGGDLQRLVEAAAERKAGVVA